MRAYLLYIRGNGMQAVEAVRKYVPQATVAYTATVQYDNEDHTTAAMVYSDLPCGAKLLAWPHEGQDALLKFGAA